MSEIPTKWAVIEFDFGEGKEHIYSLDRWEIGYYRTEEAAFDAARRMIQEGEAKKMAVLEVRALLIPKAVEFTKTV
jgi:hypothetical protein